MIECPKCGAALCLPSGPDHAQGLVIGDSPGQMEKIAGRPFVGPTGKILRDEFRRVGLDLDEFRLANYWLHDPAPAEEAYHQRLVVKEMNKHKVVLLAGSDVVYKLTGQKVSEVSGLIVKSKHTQRGTRLMASFNPAVVFKEGSVVGELRLAIERFAALYERLRT